MKKIRKYLENFDKIIPRHSSLTATYKTKLTYPETCNK